MVEDYRATRAAQIEQAGGWRNEQAADGAVVFGEWLRRYQWPSAEAELLGVASCSSPC